MIVANPLPVVVRPTFNFQHVANTIIANAIGVEALFETALDSPRVIFVQVSKKWACETRCSHTADHLLYWHKDIQRCLSSARCPYLQIH